jgi:hypothetical protein
MGFHPARAGDSPPVDVSPAETADLGSGKATITVTSAAAASMPLQVDIVVPAEVDERMTATLAGRRCRSSTRRLVCPTLELGGGHRAEIELALDAGAAMSTTDAAVVSVKASPAWMPGGYSTAISVTLSKKSQPTPATDDWTTTLRWGVASSDVGLEVPLDVDVPCARLDLPKQGTRIGTVVKGSSTGTVSYVACIDATTTTTLAKGAPATTTAAAADEASPADAIKIAVDGLPEHGAGEYEGTIDLAPDDDKTGTVDVTVDQGSNAVLPVVLLLASVVVALLIQYLRAGRLAVAEDLARCEELRGRVGTNEDDAQSVVLAFRREAGAQYPGYDLSTAVVAATGTIERGLGALRRAHPFTLAPGNDGVTKLRGELDRVGSLVDGWPAFGNDLGRLAAAVVDVQATGMVPKFVAWCRTELLDDAAADTVASLTSAVSTTARARVVAEDWPSVALRLDKARQRAKQLRSSDAHLNPEELVTLGAAQGQLSQAQVDLGLAETPETLIELRSGVVQRAIDLVDQLAHIEVKGLRQLLNASSSPDAPGVLTLGAPASIDALTGPAAMARAAQERRRTTAISGVLVAVFLALTVWTGLVALYLGKAWGSKQDMATALLWGLTGGMVSVPLAAVIEERLVAGQEGTDG